jgi:hypothetical protein
VIKAVLEYARGAVSNFPLVEPKFLPSLQVLRGIQAHSGFYVCLCARARARVCMAYVRARVWRARACVCPRRVCACAVSFDTHACHPAQARSSVRV